MLQRQQERPKTTQSTTVNYDLPLWDGQEVTSWMTQMNDAMDKIDSAMWENKTGIENEKGAAEEATRVAADANEKLEALDAWQKNIETEVDRVSKESAQAKGDSAQALQGAANATKEVQALQTIVDTQGDDISRLGDLYSQHQTTLETYGNEINRLNDLVNGRIIGKTVTYNTILFETDPINFKFIYRFFYIPNVNSHIGFIVVTGYISTHIDAFSKHLGVNRAFDITNPLYTELQNFLKEIDGTAEDSELRAACVIQSPYVDAHSFNILSAVQISAIHIRVQISNGFTTGAIPTQNGITYIIKVNLNGNS